LREQLSAACSFIATDPVVAWMRGSRHIAAGAQRTTAPARACDVIFSQLHRIVQRDRCSLARGSGCERHRADRNERDGHCNDRNKPRHGHLREPAALIIGRVEVRQEPAATRWAWSRKVISIATFLGHADIRLVRSRSIEISCTCSPSRYNSHARRTYTRECCQ